MCGVGTLASPRQEGEGTISANLRGKGDPLRSPLPLKFAPLGRHSWDQDEGDSF